MKCDICPRKCRVERSIGGGFCGAKSLKVGRVMLHNWEEPIISGTRGSGAIFFSHCNLKCIFCQNYQISHEGLGEEISPQKLASIFKLLENKGAHNINLVTPSHYTNEIIAALDIYRPKIPIVWNSSAYESAETIAKLKDYVDIYIPDLKFFDSKISSSYCRAADYFDRATAAIMQMRKNQPRDIVENGLMKKGLIIRHMILPTHAKDSIKILDYIASALGTKTYVSIMSQYIPLYKAMPPIDRKITPLEAKAVIRHAQKLGFENGFYQEQSAACEDFIPAFSNKLNLDEI